MRYAGLWRRLVAFFIDSILVGVVIAVFFYVGLAFDETWRAYRLEHPDGDLIGYPRAMELARSMNIAYCSVLFIYFTFMEASRVQGTVGKMATRVRVVDSSEARITLARSLGRNLAKVLSCLPFGLGFLWIAVSKQKQGWHDILAKTFVVLRGREGAE